MGKIDTYRVRYIKYHWDYAYTVGQIYDMPADQVERLLPDGHIEILPDDYTEPVPEPKKTEYVKVVWLKAHGYFAYSAGDVGIVDKNRLQELLDGEYVRLIDEDQERKHKNILSRIRSK